MTLRVSHAGDLGDVIFALATIRQLSPDPVDLVAYPAPGMVREPWTWAKFERAKWFIQEQPYIRSFTFEESAPGDALCIDKWRQHRTRGRLNLADHVADAFGVKHWPRREPWVEVTRPEPVLGRDVVIHRSPRYHDRNHPWRQIVERVRSRALFVGSDEECDNFNREFGADIPRYPTPTLNDLARVIKAAKLFCGNQSSPRAVAEALKVPVYVEVPRRPDNTHFARPDAWYGLADLKRVRWPKSE